jgi:plasmid stability protein
MTLAIELPDEEVQALNAKARRQGVSAEEYARQVIEQDLKESEAPTARNQKPISQIIQEIMADVPAGELAKLPSDGASQHDHYLYGWPKRSD